MTETAKPDAKRLARYRRYLKSELHAAALYSALARIENDPERSRVFQELCDSEIDHARVWATKLGIEMSPPTKLGFLGLLRFGLAKAFGTKAVIPLIAVGRVRRDP